jgi:branched-chain amino acid transport system permease protein
MTAPEGGSPQLRVTRSRQSARTVRIAMLALVAVLVALPALVDVGITAALVDVFILLALATMWNLLAGYAGLVSVGQQTFLGLGAYVVLVLAQSGMHPYLAVPFAVAFSAVAAIPISWLVLRLRGGYFAVATWVVADAVQLAISHFPSLGGGTGAILPGVTGIAPTLRLNLTYWTALAVAIGCIAVCYWLLRGRLGLTLTAIRDDEIGARSAGARVTRAKRTVFVVAAGGCGAAGAVLILSQLNVLATSVFSVQWSAMMLFATIIGGLGSIEGPIIGTIVFFTLQQLLSQYGPWYFVVLGVIAIAIALKAPRGIWGLLSERFETRFFPVGYWLWAGPPEQPQPASQAEDR